MSKDFLLELYSEEIPAALQQPAAAQLAKQMRAFFAGLDIKCESESYAAPQRIAFLAHGLPDALPARIEEVKGPSLDAPDKAIEGFLRSNDLRDTSQLAQREGKKGAFYVFEKQHKKTPLGDVLAEFLPQMISSFQWQKSMRWGEKKLRWVRPLHKILCCFDGKPVSFVVEDIKSGDTTMGHRFLHNKSVKITRADDYLKKLRAAKVIASREERITAIKEQSQKLATKNGLKVKADDALISEIAGLVEYPKALLGRIDTDFLELPQEVLISVMRNHQKYIPLAKGDKLAPAFITIANTDAPTPDITAGNERVLRARFTDAQFFWQQDLKTTLTEKREKLKEISFHAKIGTIYEKTERIKNLLEIILRGGAPLFDNMAKDIALLCKSDLVSQMVFEFPELQGTMGYYYSLADDEAVIKDINVPKTMDDGARKIPVINHRVAENAIKKAEAIRDHYKPMGIDDDIPATEMGCYLALADKMDTLTQFWLIDEKPTSSKDPYALRRAALGVIRILEILPPVDLSLLIGEIFHQPPRSHEKAEELFKSLLDFIHERLKFFLRNKRDISPDIVDAVMATDSSIRDIGTIIYKAEELNNFLNTEDGKNLFIAYKRAYKICEQENKLPQSRASILYQEKYISKPEEKALYAAIKNLDISNLQSLAGLRRFVDDFFDNVQVNDPAPKIRENRLQILRYLIITMRQYAAFELIEKRD